MKTLIVILLCLSLTACGWFDRAEATLTGYSEHCIDGVEYIQFRNGATVKHLPSGEVSTC